MFQHPEFDRHESVHTFYDAASGLRALIAVHSTALGPAVGGCRLWTYPDVGAALTDVLRLSRGMSLKNAMAGLPLGGGKAVLMGPVAPEARTRAFQVFGDWVDSLGGRYLTAEDVGTSVADMETVAQRTPFVGGLASRAGELGGDPSPFTARGVCRGIEAAVRWHLGRESLEGVRVAVQGLGHVGQHLCAELAQRGAELIVADVDPARVAAVQAAHGARAESPCDILAAEADVVAPCALGAVLDRASVAALRAPIVAGAANNQLADARVGELLTQRGILYAPDFVINAGGIICVSAERVGATGLAQVQAEVDRIGARLGVIFARAEHDGLPTQQVAERMALERIGAGRRPQPVFAGTFEPAHAGG